MRASVVALAAAVSPFAAPARASAEIPRAVIVLESFQPRHAAQEPAAAPPRFVLLEDGTVFVGGTAAVWSARLSGGELKALERRVDALRRITALAGSVRLGAGDERRRLVLRKGRPVDARLEGALEGVSPSLQLLADFVRDLERFHHPALRPYSASSFALSAREGTLAGGCRSWTAPPAVADAVFAPLVVGADRVETWPRGANPAQVCVDAKRYVVTFRPLLPGETP